MRALQISVSWSKLFLCKSLGGLRIYVMIKSQYFWMFPFQFLGPWNADRVKIWVNQVSRSRPNLSSPQIINLDHPKISWFCHNIARKGLLMRTIISRSWLEVALEYKPYIRTEFSEKTSLKTKKWSLEMG